MIDIAITAIIPIFLIITVLWKNKKIEDNQSFFSKDYTNTLKGIAAIVVIIVHIPKEYQNPLQDMIGSIAYVCVTFFFLVSAYGMQYNVENKPHYLSRFWGGRLISLLVPCVIINVARFLYHVGVDGEFNWSVLYNIDSYVRILLEYCLIFYLVSVAISRIRIKHKYRLNDIILISAVILSSCYIYFIHPIKDGGGGWPYERYGLIWGLVLYRYFNSIVRWLNKTVTVKTIALFVACVVLGLLYLKYKTVWFYGEYLLKIILGFVIMVFVFLVSQKRLLKNPISEFLGKISYEIYLSHGFIMIVISHFMPAISSGLFVLLTVLSTIVFSYVVNLIVRPAVPYLRNKIAA